MDTFKALDVIHTQFHELHHKIGGLHTCVTDIITAIEAAARKDANNYQILLTAYESVQDSIKSDDVETTKTL
jgi:hypothetical protein